MPVATLVMGAIQILAILELKYLTQLCPAVLMMEQVILHFSVKNTFLDVRPVEDGM